MFVFYEKATELQACYLSQGSLNIMSEKRLLVCNICKLHIFMFSMPIMQLLACHEYIYGNIVFPFQIRF